MTKATTQPTAPAWPRIVLVGVVAGFLSGLLGVGGGIVIVPGLVLVGAFEHKLATGTSLAAIIPISISGIVGYATQGSVDWPVAAAIASSAMIGAVVGSWLLVRVKAPTLQMLFSGVLVIAGVRMFLVERDGLGRGDLTLTMILGLVALGLATGTLSSLFGVGGGIMIVPMLGLFFGVPHLLAKGTSLAVILPTAVVGTLRNRRNGLTALVPAAVIGLSGAVFALAGARVAQVIDPGVARAIFAVFLLLVSVRLLRAARQSRQMDSPAS